MSANRRGGKARLDDPDVAPGALGVARRQRVEQLLHDVLIDDVGGDQAARVQGRRPALGDAALGHGDDLLRVRAQLLGARHGGLDVLVLQQGRRQLRSIARRCSVTRPSLRWATR